MTKFYPGDLVSFKRSIDGVTLTGNIYGSFKKSPDIYRIVYWDDSKATHRVCNKYAEDLTFVEHHSAVKRLVEAAEKSNVASNTIKASDVLKVYGFGTGDKVRVKDSRSNGVIVGFRLSENGANNQIRVEYPNGNTFWYYHYELEHVPTPAPEPKFKVGDKVKITVSFSHYSVARGDTGTVIHLVADKKDIYTVRLDKTSIPQTLDLNGQWLKKVEITAPKFKVEKKTLSELAEAFYDYTSKRYTTAGSQGYDLASLAQLVKRLAEEVEDNA